jgi:hypothetical protein
MQHPSFFFSAEAIANLVNLLTPDRVRIAIVAKEVEKDADQLERRFLTNFHFFSRLPPLHSRLNLLLSLTTAIYGTQYSTAPMSAELLKVAVLRRRLATLYFLDIALNLERQCNLVHLDAAERGSRRRAAPPQCQRVYTDRFLNRSPA